MVFDLIYSFAFPFRSFTFTMRITKSFVALNEIHLIYNLLYHTFEHQREKRTVSKLHRLRWSHCHTKLLCRFPFKRHFFILFFFCTKYWSNCVFSFAHRRQQWTHRSVSTVSSAYGPQSLPWMLLLQHEHIDCLLFLFSIHLIYP